MLRSLLLPASLAAALAASPLQAAAAGTASVAAAADAPYTLEVWSNVLFGPEGTATEITLIDEASYPAAFAGNVKARLARAKVPPPQRDGQPTTLRTGVMMRFEITPAAGGGGQVRVAGLSVSPLPLKRYYASYPKDIAGSAGWQGEVEGLCTVAVDGRCRSIEVKALPGIPESVRRYARVSLEGWTFAPQELGGQPIEGEYRLRLQLNTLDDQPEDFRDDKFERLKRIR